MKTTLLATTALMLGCIDLDIIGGTETTAGSTTSMTGSSSTEGDGDGDSTTSGPGTDGDGDGEPTEGTESGDTSTETSVGDGDGEIGDGDADPGDGDGDGWLGQICWTSTTTVYFEPGPDCAPNTAHACFVGELGIPNASVAVCCTMAAECEVAMSISACPSGHSGVCEIG
jgi:hypothetical protein